MTTTLPLIDVNSYNTFPNVFIDFQEKIQQLKSSSVPEKLTVEKIDTLLHSYGHSRLYSKGKFKKQEKLDRLNNILNNAKLITPNYHAIIMITEKQKSSHCQNISSNREGDDENQHLKTESSHLLYVQTSEREIQMLENIYFNIEIYHNRELIFSKQILFPELCESQEIYNTIYTHITKSEFVISINFQNIFKILNFVDNWDEEEKSLSDLLESKKLISLFKPDYPFYDSTTQFKLGSYYGSSIYSSFPSKKNTD